MIERDSLRDLVGAVVEDLTESSRGRNNWILAEVLTSKTLQSADVSILVPVQGYYRVDGTKDPDGWARIDISVRGSWVASPAPGARPGQ